MKPLFIPLKTEFFRAFQRGEKTTEFRKYGSRWNEATCTPGRAVVLSHGYGKRERLTGTVKSLTVRTDPENLPGWATCYGPGPAKIAAIEITNLCPF